MHPTRCWQGSGRDELIGLFHPLCFKSTAWMGPCTYPPPLLAASSGHPPAHQRGDLPGCVTAAGAVLLLCPRAASHCDAVHRRSEPRRSRVPFSHCGGKSGQGLGKHPREVGIFARPRFASGQAGERGFRERCLSLEGVGGCCRGEMPPYPSPDVGYRCAAGSGRSLRLGAKAEVRHAPAAGSFPSKQLGALIPLCERKPAAVLTVRPRRGLKKNPRAATNNARGRTALPLTKPLS